MRVRSSRAGALHQPLAETALAAQPRFKPAHVAIVPFVVVTEEVQEAMEGEHTQLGRLRVAGGSRLPSGDTACDHDISEERIASLGDYRGAARKAEDVGRHVLSSVRAIQCADPRVADDGDADASACAWRRHAG